MHIVYKGDRVMNTLQDLIKKYAAQYKEQVVAWRRHIHSHPELSGEEKNNYMTMTVTPNQLIVKAFLPDGTQLDESVIEK